jgi:hypothetical protein
MLAMVSGVRALPRETVYLDGLLAAASRMARATQFREVLAVAVEQAEEFLGPVGGMLVLLDASKRMLVIAALEDVPDSVICGNKSLPLAAHLPMADAVNTAQAIWISGADERARRYPELAARTPEQYACGSLPLADAEVPLGLLCLIRMGAGMGTGAAPKPFDETERAFAGVLADLVAAAVGRLTGVRESTAGPDTDAEGIGIYERDPVGAVAQAIPAGSDRAGELARHPANAAILGQLSAALATAVTVADFRQATAAALPVLGADGLVIAGQEADRVYVVACAGVTSALTRQLDSLPRAARMPTGETLSNRVPEYARSTDMLLARHPHFRSMLGGLADHAWAILPLASGYDAPAACLLAFPPGWSPAGSEQARFIMASGLLAQALDRCRTHDHEHHLVSQMQHGPPASLPGLALAYGYRPSTFGLGVGGDFYDALLQPDGTTALVIGDIQGHGSHVAAMADRLRTALRAYALDGHAPAEVMARASRFLAHLNRDRDNAQYATCCYVTFVPSTGHVQICCAGHPRPIMLTENAPASLLGLDTGLTLGVDPDHRYSASAFTLAEGSTLVLYTDGLIERPGSDITLTTGEILRELDEIRSAQPAAVLAGLHPLSDPGPRYDDIAVLAARRTSEPA